MKSNIKMHLHKTNQDWKMVLRGEREKDEGRFMKNTVGVITCISMLTATTSVQLYNIYSLLFLSPPLGYILPTERSFFISFHLLLLLSLLPLSHYFLYLLTHPSYSHAIKGYPFWFNALGLATSFVSLVMFKWWWVLALLWPILLLSTMAMYTEGTTIYTSFMPYSSSQSQIN
jgi:hypothetical protein